MIGRSVLALLGEADLRALATAIRSKRLGPPFGITAVQRITGPAAAAAVSDALISLSSEGSSYAALASFLEIVADTVATRPLLEDNIQLVMTGPEGQGYHRETAVVVHDLFRRAKSSILVAGYAVYQGKEIFEELGRRIREMPSLQARLFLNITRRPEDRGQERELVAAFVSRFKKYQWPEGCPLPEIYYDRRALCAASDAPVAMHAKCIVVDAREVFISSANLTEAAQHRNIEVGVILRSPTMAQQAIEFFTGMTRDGICVLASG